MCKHQLIQCQKEGHPDSHNISTVFRLFTIHSTGRQTIPTTEAGQHPISGDTSKHTSCVIAMLITIPSTWCSQASPHLLGSLSWHLPDNLMSHSFITAPANICKHQAIAARVFLLSLVEVNPPRPFDGVWESIWMYYEFLTWLIEGLNKKIMVCKTFSINLWCHMTLDWLLLWHAAIFVVKQDLRAWALCTNPWGITLWIQMEKFSIEWLGAASVIGYAAQRWLECLLGVFFCGVFRQVHPGGDFRWGPGTLWDSPSGIKKGRGMSGIPENCDTTLR